MYNQLDKLWPNKVSTVLIWTIITRFHLQELETIKKDLKEQAPGPIVGRLYSILMGFMNSPVSSKGKVIYGTHQVPIDERKYDLKTADGP